MPVCEWLLCSISNPPIGLFTGGRDEEITNTKVATTKAHRTRHLPRRVRSICGSESGTAGRRAATGKAIPVRHADSDIKAWQESMRAELRTVLRRPISAVRGTLEADAKRYLAQVAHLASYKSRVCEVDAWTALYGRLRRVQITAEHLRKARAQWSADEYTPKTINNRVQTLRHLFHVLDGRRSPTPADDVTPLPVPDSPKVLVNAKVFRTVAANLTVVAVSALPHPLEPWSDSRPR
jgi:hypothetical protein